jgi:hypothetical protein
VLAFAGKRHIPKIITIKKNFLNIISPSVVALSEKLKGLISQNSIFIPKIRKGRKS